MFTEDPSPGSSITPANQRAVWLQERKTGIGASDAAAVFGLSPYKSPLALYFEKRGEVEMPESEREALYWGRVLQSPIARRYEYETDREIEEPDQFAILRHPTHPFMLATLDATAMAKSPTAKQPPAGGRGVVEIKNAGFFKKEEWRDEPPLAFQIQAQHQMFVAGAEWASLAALVGGVEFFWADIARHNGFINVLLNKVGEFWSRVQSGTPPEADGTESTRQLLKQLYPRDNGEIITLESKWANVDDELVRIKIDQKKYQERRDKLENELKLAIGTATAAQIDGSTAVYTHKWQERREFTTPASAFRVLRRKGE